MLFYNAEESVVFTKDLQDIKVTRLPSSPSFECELNRSNVPVTWYKDDQPLRRSQRLALDVEGRVHRLTIKNVESADEAVYSVVAKNARSAAKLSVQCEYFFAIMADSSFMADPLKNEEIKEYTG